MIARAIFILKYIICKDDEIDITLGRTDAEVDTYIQEAITGLEELELFKSEHLRLEAELNTILHPNGDGPNAPSFCDLVAFVRNDLKPKTCEGCIHYSKHTNFGNWCNCNRNQTGDKYDTMVHER